MKTTAGVRRGSLYAAFAIFLVVIFSADTGFLNHAAMQNKKAATTNTSLALPDLGIGASFNGARPFPSNNAWNMDISRYPVHLNSANLIASIGNNTGLHPDFGTFWQGEPIGFPYDVVAGSQQQVPMDFIWWPDQSDPGPYPFPADAPVEGGLSSTGDRHVLVIDRDNWKLYETYSSYPQNNGTSWQAGNGAVWNLSSNKLRPVGWTSADAAGLAIFPGLVRRDEVVGQGEIRHAFRFTAQTSRKSFVYPATHQAGSTTNTNAPPMGMRVRLKASKIITGFSPHIQVILKAMKKYGMILADNGSNWFVSGSHDPQWDDEELDALSQIKGSDFEVVDTPTRLVMPVSDFDGDGMTDISVYSPADGSWNTVQSGGGSITVFWGVSTDIPVPGDYDGDGKTDQAVYRPEYGTWFIKRSSDGGVTIIPWGISTDKPVPGDYDGDGKVDLAVYRPEAGMWFVLKSSDGTAMVGQWGIPTDIPTQADFDGDGKCDFAVYRPSGGMWFVRKSTGGVSVVQFGISEDKPVQADYDGDGKDDIAVFRPSAGFWFILRSTDGGVSVVSWGLPTDTPIPGDYDGDGKDDVAMYRDGFWFIVRSTNGQFVVANLGQSTDKPVPSGYLSR